MAKSLNMSLEKFKKQYIRRVGLRYSLIEKSDSKDCVLLTPTGCQVYTVRPLQCRTWPFWRENLASRTTWRQAGQNCPGIDTGLWHDFDRIEAIRKGDLSDTKGCCMDIEVAAVNWIIANLNNKSPVKPILSLYQDIGNHIPLCITPPHKKQM